MALPEIELHRVNKLLTKFCEQRVPPEVRDQIKILFTIKGNKVILVESRPYYNDPTKWSEMPVAQFEYTETTRQWSLFGYDRNDRRLLVAKGSLEKLIQEVDKDSTVIFWG
jgi:hypothetical protein